MPPRIGTPRLPRTRLDRISAFRIARRSSIASPARPFPVSPSTPSTSLFQSRNTQYHGIQTRSSSLLGVQARGPRAAQEGELEMVRSASTVASAASSPTADGTEAVEVNTVKENSTIVLRDLEDHVVEAEDVGEINPLTRYHSLIEQGLLKDDPHQSKIIGILQEMHDQLKGYSPKVIPEGREDGGGIFSRLFGSSNSSREPSKQDLSSTPLGLYLHGSVGTGKTMLMDLFYDTLPKQSSTTSSSGSGAKGNFTRKRVHFHAFMLDVFRRVHEVKYGLPKGGIPSSSDPNIDAGQAQVAKQKAAKQRNVMEGRSATGAVGVEALSGGGLFKGFWGKKGKDGEVVSEEDAIYEVAKEMAREGRVLCFDEFQVTDIVTAMILRQLLSLMMSYGVVCIMTSNRHPDELYMNGIQRGSFLPCIELVKERFRVVDLNSETDYRRLPRTLSKVYFSPLNQDSRSEMRKLFEGFTKTDDDGNAPSPSSAIISNRNLHIFGRNIRIPESTKDVARFTFDELCGHPLSSADYLEITKNFGTIFLEDVPRMNLGQKDLARRFITFIDACYENKTRLFLSSEVSIYQIFSDDVNSSAGDVHDHMRHVMDDLGLAADDVKASSLFSGQEELFAFARCVSRLVQMGTKEWTASAHTAHMP